jgi:hypothetical protein
MHRYEPIDIVSDLVLIGLIIWLTGWNIWWQIGIIVVGVFGFLPPTWGKVFNGLIFIALFAKIIPMPI